MIGSKLAHYRILAKLGEGGMGIVFLAEDERLHRKVALKTLPPALAEDPHRLARFEREVRSVATLNHPNIVTIYSVEEADGKRFFTMEHVEGKTLSQLLPPGGLPLKEFLKIALPLADALAAAHAKGIQHRDLKPGNVMVNSDGRVKVLDFGLAKLRESETTDAMGFHPQTSLTQEGLAIGTLAYMAPEQLRMQATDHRADIFSLGVVLYEMATGHCPFLGQSTAEVISAILRDQPARAFEENQQIPAQIDSILRRCLEKEPAKRWATAVELRDKLAEVSRAVDLGQTGSLVSKTPSDTVEIVRSRSTRFGIAALAIVLLGAGALAWRARVPRAAGGGVTLAGENGGGGGAVPAAAKVPSLVVLPLSNFANEPEYFVDGMTDALISALARIQGVRVISRQSAMHYKDSKKLLPEIARELGVDFVVEGSVTRSADRVRLNAQVIQADPETTLWSESFERATQDVVALQNTFASAIAHAVHAQISPVEETQMASTKSVDPKAYEAYLQGRYWAGKHGAESFRKAQGYFERAIAIDSAFAPAWTDLAAILQRQGYFFADLAPKLVQAETAVQRALDLDPTSAAAHAVLGDLHLARWNWDAAEQEIRKAVGFEPNSSVAHLNYWRLLMRLRRFEEARREIELARTLDPVSANITANYGYQFSVEGRCQEALGYFDQTLELDPDFTLVHAYAWLCHHQLERDPERGRELRSWLLAEQLDEVVPEFERRLARDGYPSALSWVANRLDAMADNPNVTVGLVAGLLATAGEPDKAMRWLERGYEKRAWSLGWIATMLDLQSLRGREDFRSLVRKMNLPDPGE
ncbi:MAG: protein kinase [Thermoanaerobaculia bacterium]|nr:protein kinase [Thermoanaerobaculia bacterium]